MTLAVFLAALAGSLLVLWLWPKRPETIEEQAQRFVRERRAREKSEHKPAPPAL